MVSFFDRYTSFRCYFVIAANANSVFIWYLVVKPDTLTDMTNQMTEKVGLVHGLPYVADRQGFAATLEQVMATSNNMLSLHI